MNNNTGDIINSINGIKKAEAPAQFYAGVRAKMARQQNAGTVNRQLSTVNYLKPIFITAVLFLFLITNIIVLTNNKRTKKSEPENTAATIQEFAEDYHLNSTGFAQ